MTASSPPGVPFVLYALQGRVYASNVKQKLIDLGSQARESDGTYAYLLDGDHTTGSGFDSPEAALAHVAHMVSFLFLDGDQHLILERMRARKGHFMRESMVQSQFDTLERPDGEAGVFHIDIDGTFEQVVDRAVSALEQAV